MNISYTPPKEPLWHKLYSGLRYILSRHLSLYASHTAYFMILSVFPSLVLFLSILRYTGLEINTVLNALQGAVPNALMPYVRQLMLNTYVHSTTAVISISAITALWSASRGIYGLITGLNAIYGVAENRGYLYTRLISAVYTFLFIIVTLLTLVIHVFGSSILALLPDTNLLIFDILTSIIRSRFLSLFVVQTLFFATMFMVLPNKRNHFRDSLPGAVMASLGWLLFTALYSVYVAHVTMYTTIFGSVYIVALGMLWLYCCLFIVFSGGALNQHLMKNVRPAKKPSV